MRHDLRLPANRVNSVGMKDRRRGAGGRNRVLIRRSFTLGGQGLAAMGRAQAKLPEAIRAAILDYAG